MNSSVLIPKSAWLPLTPRGVAAFAPARFGRLLAVQFIVALIAAGAFGWFLHSAWAPAFREAISHLPDGAKIQNGSLEWPEPSPVLLAEGTFLAFAVDLDHTGAIASTAHLQVEFGKRDWQVRSLLGVLDVPSLLDTSYPKSRVILLEQSEAGPWWGAREPFLILLAMAGLVIYLMISWPLLATLYTVPVWLVGFFSNRQIGWAGSWRLAGAALMPGALLLTVSMVLYGLRMFDLVKFAFAFGMHLLIGVIYIFASPLFLPRLADVPKETKNPFG
jgi:hypothetical protein